MTITSAELVIVGCGVAGRAAARQAIDEGYAPLVLAGPGRATQLEIGDPLAGIPHRLHTARGTVEATTVILAAGAQAALDTVALLAALDRCAVAA